MTIESNRWFRIVREHIDCMLEFGRGPDCPLFGGMIDMARRQVIVALSPPPPGVRMTDFNWCGNNFMHDIPLLEVMIALTELTGDMKYDAAVDEMFAFYGKHCAHPDTGLFGWGEHAQWSFADRDILSCTFTNGMTLSRRYMVHDHLRCAPLWFWDRMWKHHPDAVVRFAHGLNGHIVDVETFEHNRHAALTANWWRDPTKPDFDKGKDFARHAGFHIIDCLFAYKRSGDRALLDWSRGILNWHLGHRLPNGIIRGCVRSEAYESEGQHDSLALSVVCAADILGRDTPEGREFSGYADDLFEARRKQRSSEPLHLPEQPDDPRQWIVGYFRKNADLPPRVEGGNMLTLMHRHAGIAWYADQLVESGRLLARHLPKPPQIPLLASAFHQHMETLLLAHLQSGDADLLDAARKVAGWAQTHLHCEGMLRGACGYGIYGMVSNFEWHCDPWVVSPPTPGYYYSVTGTPLLIRTLLHLALIEEEESDVLGPDPHRR